MNKSDELLNKYDEVINITMVNLYTLCKESQEIVVSDFDRKNKDHLFILRVALLAKDVYGFPMKMRVGFWDWLSINWKIRKLSRHIPRSKEPGSSTVNVPGLIDFMYGPVRGYLGEDFTFADIYEEFYKGELG